MSCLSSIEYWIQIKKKPPKSLAIHYKLLLYFAILVYNDHAGATYDICIYN